jgi:hypothetical protein
MNGFEKVILNFCALQELYIMAIEGETFILGHEILISVKFHTRVFI